MRDMVGRGGGMRDLAVRWRDEGYGMERWRDEGSGGERLRDERSGGEVEG